MSAVQTFKRCGKKYEIQYMKLLDGVKESPALDMGRRFHSIMEHYAKERVLVHDQFDDMSYVASSYITRRGFPDKESIMRVEEPIYVEVLPRVFVRCTMDLVYKRAGTIVIRDYKTFSRMPSPDVDLDFQVRLYLALAMKHFETDDIVFCHEYVRTTPPDVPKDKAGNCWSPEECYVSTEIAIGKREQATILGELKYDLGTLQESEKHNFYTRSPMKGGGYMDCDRCSVKELCKAELQHGSLDLIDLIDLSVAREPLYIPETFTER
jgi:hypothetical protein